MRLRFERKSFQAVKWHKNTATVGIILNSDNLNAEIYQIPIIQAPFLLTNTILNPTRESPFDAGSAV